jgi:predicted O-linked N-acetylglucosamine transferase (SPINDLY family)
LNPDDYLKVTPWLPRQQFASFLDDMDIYLDCPNFSGYTTAWQAAHRGVPVVTLEGEFLRQRLAAGLLRQIGVTEGIADSQTSYVETALRFARQCRESKGRKRRREMAAAASDRADGNIAAVRAFERTLIEAAAP